MKLQYIKGGFGGMPYFFNLSSPVGRGYSSAPYIETAFVQFCFAAMVSPKSESMPPADLIPAWTRVRVSGQLDADTENAIVAMQQLRRTKFGRQFEVDGIVSVAPPNVVDYGEQVPYSIVFLNYALIMATSSLWPRLDKHSACTPELGPWIRNTISEYLT